MFTVTSCARVFTLERIHLSAAVSSSGFMSAGTSAFSIFIIMKREAFQILLAKLRLASTRSI